MEFHILGPVEVVHEGRNLPLGRSRERAVLAVLLLSANRVVSAERLVDDLWSGEPPEGAIQALRVFVSRLRKALREAGGDGLIVTEPAGYVARVEPAALDAARFEALVAAGREQARRGDHHQASATLGEALALWRGPALADVADSALARDEAARLEECRLAALEERLEADLACGRHGELVAELDSLTRAHPLRERLWGQRMVALYRAGRQADALRVYQDLRAILGEDLGLEPSSALAHLEGAILRHEPALDWRAATAEGTPPAEEGRAQPLFAERTPYVGRDAELTELGRLIDAAVRGTGALVLIGGEPGVGKTRLSHELGVGAARLGMTVLMGRFYEIEGTPPYVALVEILEQMLAQASSPQDFRQLVGEEAPEVAKLLPRLRRLFPDIPPPLELPAEQERRYLFNSVREYMARAASARPLFIVFDDLHWADEPTLLLLEHLAERLPETPILAVGTYRDTEVSSGHPLARTFDALIPRGLAQRVSLRRLPEDGVAGMLLAMSGQPPPPSLVDMVHAETEGNPFFVEEVFKHLAEEGRLLGPDGRFRPEVAIGELDVPESLRLVLGRRLERLGEDGRRALAAAAVVGRAFTYELLEALGELEPDALLEALDEAERARLVAPMSEAADEDRLLFSHELIRQTLLTGLSQPRRQRLHLRVAQTLERLHADALEDQASEIADHLAHAGPAADRAKLLRYHSLAGRRAMSTAGFEDALRHFEQALTLKELAESVERPRLLVDLALAQRSLGRLEDSLESWKQALDAYEDLGDAEGVAQMCFEASQELWWLNRDHEALPVAQRGLLSLGHRATSQRTQMLGWTGAAGAWITPYRLGSELIDEALALAEQLGDKRLLGHVLMNKALHRFAFSHHQEALEAGFEGTTLLRGAGELWPVATVLAFTELAAVELGQMALAAEIGEEVDRLGQRLGHSFALWVLHYPAQWGRAFAVDPNLDRYEEFARRHLEMAGPVGFRHMSYAFLGHAALLRGDWPGSLRLAEEGTRHAPATKNTGGMEWGGYLLALAYGDDRARVLTVLEERKDDIPQPGQPNGWGLWLIPLSGVEALYLVGEREGAAALYPLVREFIATTGVVLTTWHCRLTERVAGIAAAAGEQWELAERHFHTALRQAEELPHVLEGAETRRFYAQMLLERDRPGDGDKARRLLEEAMTVYRRIGMPRHEELARALSPA